MTSTAFWWLALNVFSIVVLSFFSMMEMACVSFNRVRLQYYVSKGERRAIWLNALMQQPSKLFGTTLIGVNAAMMFGSEFSREFYSAIGLSPDLAPLTQVVIIVIFGELAPMFAARRYAEDVALSGIPLVYTAAKLMAPILWVIDLVATFANFIMGGKKINAEAFLSQDELQKILEEREEDFSSTATTEKGLESKELNLMVSNIFNLRNKDAAHIMDPLDSVKSISAETTVGEMRHLLKKVDQSFFPIRTSSGVVGIAFPRDFIRAQDGKKIRELARTPWFITKQTKALQILQQFRKNNQTVAIVLNDKGFAVGIITLDALTEEIFGKYEYRLKSSQRKKAFVVEQTFPGNMKISDFNARFGVTLDGQEGETLSQLMIQLLGHMPAKGDSINIASFEFTVKEVSLLEVKTIVVKARFQ
jgi:CBS domain containing-hemolysin-like protein